MEYENEVRSPVEEMAHSKLERESYAFSSFDELDQDPRLLTAIQMQDWENVGYFLQNDTWVPGSFGPQAESFDPETEVRRWSITKDSSNNELWRKLPLHLAIARKAPKGVLESLVNIFPESLQQPDTAGNLPLHLVFAHDYSNDVVALFIQQYPEAVQRNNLQSLTPMECINQNIVSEESLYMNAKQGGREASTNDVSRENSSKQSAVDEADNSSEGSAFQPLVTRIVIPGNKSNQDRRAAMRKTHSGVTRTNSKKSRWKSMLGSFRTSKKELKRIDEEGNDNDSSDYAEANVSESKKKRSFFPRLKSKKNMSTTTTMASSVSSSGGSRVESAELSVSDTAEPTDDSTTQSPTYSSLQVDSYDESNDRLVLPSQTKSQSSENLSEYQNICSIQEDLEELKNSLGPEKESKSPKRGLSGANSKALYAGSTTEGNETNENSVDDSKQLSNTSEKKQEDEIRDDSTLSDIELLSLAMNKHNLQRAISDLMGGNEPPVRSRTKKVSFKDQAEVSLCSLSTGTNEVSIAERDDHDGGGRRIRSSKSSCGDLVGDLSLLASSYIEDVLGDDETLDSVSYDSDSLYGTDLSSTDYSEGDDETIESSVLTEPERGWRPLSRWDRAASQRRKTRTMKEGGKSTATKQSSFLRRRKQNQEPEAREERDEQLDAKTRQDHSEDPTRERDVEEIEQDDWFCLSPEQAQFFGGGTLQEDDTSSHVDSVDIADETRRAGLQSNASEEERNNHESEKSDSLIDEEEGEPKKKGRTFSMFRKPSFLKRRRKNDESNSNSFRERETLETHTLETHHEDEEEDGHRIVWMHPSHPPLVSGKDTQGMHVNRAMESSDNPLHNDGSWSAKSHDVQMPSTDEAGEGWATPESWFALNEFASNEEKESFSYPTVLSEKRVETSEGDKNVYLVQVTFTGQ